MRMLVSFFGAPVPALVGAIVLFLRLPYVAVDLPRPLLFFGVFYVALGGLTAFAYGFHRLFREPRRSSFVMTCFFVYWLVGLAAYIFYTEKGAVSWGAYFDALAQNYMVLAQLLFFFTVLTLLVSVITGLTYWALARPKTKESDLLEL